MSKQLKDLAYYKTGGSCMVLYEPLSAEELAAQVKEIAKAKMPFFLLGGGTNSLVMDEPYPGAVIAFHKMNKIELHKGDRLRVQAGVDNTTAAQFALKHRLNGVSWMNRLPGQLGGTVRMNARCYGGEISQVVTTVFAVSRDGDIREYNDPKIFRGYKDTLFMENGDLITGAILQLSPGDPASIQQHMLHCESDRKSKGQFDFPSCGCVFKNDYTVGVSSGMLLDVAGARSLSTKTVEISPGHANFVYNKGASSREILEVTFKMRDLVYERFGAWLEYEMEILGHIPADLQSKIALKKPHQLKLQELTPLRQRMQRKI